MGSYAARYSALQASKHAVLKRLNHTFSCILAKHHSRVHLHVANRACIHGGATDQADQPCRKAGPLAGAATPSGARFFLLPPRAAAAAEPDAAATLALSFSAASLAAAALNLRSSAAGPSAAATLLAFAGLRRAAEPRAAEPRGPTAGEGSPTTATGGKCTRRHGVLLANHLNVELQCAQPTSMLLTPPSQNHECTQFGP